MNKFVSYFVFFFAANSICVGCATLLVQLLLFAWASPFRKSLEHALLSAPKSSDRLKVYLIFCNSSCLFSILNLFRKVTIFEQSALDTDNKSQLSTLVLRGSTHNVLEDFDRAVTDAVHAYKTFTKVPLKKRRGKRASI